MSAASAIELMDPLAETIDEARSHSPTPVEGIAIRLRAAIDEHTVPPGWASEVIDAIVVEVAQRTAEQRARELAAGDSLPRRVRELEAHAKSHAEWRSKLTGADDANGRMGRLEAKVSSLLAGWKRILGALAAAGAIAGGGIYTVRESYDAEVEARGVTKQWRRGVEEDFRRLFAAFGWDRPASASPPQPPPTTGTP